MGRACLVRRAAGRYLRGLLSIDDTPHRIALAFAIGVFLAFTPLLGLQTILALLLAFLLGLNRPAVLVGVFVSNPWTLVPIYTFAAWIGGLIVGSPASATLPHFGWGDLVRGDFWLGLLRNWELFKPFLLGSGILSIAAAFPSYLLVRIVIVRGRRAAGGRDTNPCHFTPA